MNQDRISKILLLSIFAVCAAHGSMAETVRSVYSAAELSVAGQQSEDKVKGNVKSDSGEPLAGAMVYIKGSATGVQTDFDGNYSIEAPKDAEKGYILVFQYLGMVTKEIPVKKARLLNVVLMQDNELEAAVVNVGYGVIQNMENLTGSAFEITSSDIAKKPANRIDNLLAGLVPGLNVTETKSSGRSSVSIRIRGEGSLSASSEPLWVIDGVPIYTGSKTNSVSGTSYTVSPLSFLNPDDIESMTVLKDAATATIYGADGANGVIFVKTKKAQTGKSSYNLSVKYGLSAIDRSTTLKVLNAAQWRQIATETWENSGYSMKIFPYQDNEYNTYSTTDTDWFDVYMNTGQTTQMNFSVNGGTESLHNYFSSSYYWERSPYSTSRQNSRRVTLRDNADFNIARNLGLNVIMAGTYRDDDLPGLYSFFDETLPIFSPYDNNGDLRFYNYYSSSLTAYEPVLKKFYANNLLPLKYDDNNQKTLTADVNAILSYKIMDGLQISSNTGFSTRCTYENTYTSKNTPSGTSSVENHDGSSLRAGVFSYIMTENLRANFSRVFGRHNVNAMAGVEFLDKKYFTLNSKGYGFVTDNLKEVTYANAETKTGTSTAKMSRKLSFIFNGSYTFDKRYTVSLTARSDGNSEFSTYARWQVNASAGFAWNIHNENFFGIKDLIHLLRFKASFGTMGNSTVDSSVSYGSYSLTTSNYYGGILGATQSSPANPGLSWEKAYSTNVGIDIGLLKRLEIKLEGYNKISTDMIYSGRVSSVITDMSVPRNVAEMTNSGIEVSIVSTNIKNADFEWRTSFNGSRNWNKITKLYKDTYSGFFDSAWMVGQSKDALWLVKYAGVDPTNGAPMWYDKKGNLTYTFSYDDRVFHPNYRNTPDFIGGMRNTLTYKGFVLNISLLYQFGGWTKFSKHIDDGSSIITDNGPIEMLDHWQKPGDVTMNPKLLYKNSYHATVNSTRNLVNTTCIRLNNVSLTYNLPDRAVKAMRMRSIDVSIIADNLYTFTPGQSRKRNSYKTLMVSGGITRTVSAEFSFGF